MVFPHMAASTDSRFLKHRKGFRIISYIMYWYIKTIYLMNEEKCYHKMQFQILLKPVKKKKYFPLASVRTTPISLLCFCFHFLHVHLSASNFYLNYTHKQRIILLFWLYTFVQYGNWLLRHFSFVSLLLWLLINALLQSGNFSDGTMKCHSAFNMLTIPLVNGYDSSASEWITTVRKVISLCTALTPVWRMCKK